MSGGYYLTAEPVGVCSCHACTCSGCQECDPPDEDAYDVINHCDPPRQVDP